jgi:hypothetical protein
MVERVVFEQSGAKVVAPGFTKRTAGIDSVATAESVAIGRIDKSEVAVTEFGERAAPRRVVVNVNGSIEIWCAALAGKCPASTPIASAKSPIPLTA